jgi:branched-chain amino acid transport system substrate-binding protein
MPAMAMPSPRQSRPRTSDSIVGPIAFDGKGLPPFAARNICKTPLVGGQWRLKDGGGYDLVIVDNSDQPSIPTGGTMQPIS